MFRVVLLAAALIGWSFVGPRTPPRSRVPVQAGLGGRLAVLTRARLGLWPPRLWSGLRLGVPVAAATIAGIAACTAVPPVRAAMSARPLPAPATGWLAVQIPFGTVWAEEAAFRAALGTLAADAFGPGAGRMVQAAVFGLCHIADARGTGAPVAPTVLATGVAGWVLGRLAERSGSLAAPMLTHLAINEAGAVAALAVQPATRTAGPGAGAQGRS